MTLIEPTNKDIINPAKKKKYPASLRFWHWTNMLVITCSLITVLINATLNDKANITQVIQEQFSGKGLTLTPAQGSSLSHALQDEVWAIHTYFGYLLAGLFLFRLVMEFFQLADQKLIRKISAAYAQFHTTKQNRKLMLHELTVKAIYAIFYLLLLIMVFTGLPGF